MISIKNVTFSYEAQSSSGLTDVTLNIKQGECVLLCGKSGCGKTTLTRLLNGIIPNFLDGDLTGEVVIDGESVPDQAMYQIARRVGSVFQNPRTQFYTTNTTAEIAFGCENLGMPMEEIQERVHKAAHDLKIENLLNKNIFKLSGGEKQIIAFAGVYAMSPDVYVLDEPSSNLDVQAIEKLREILGLLKRQGKTIVIAEHRIYYLKELADRAIHLECGRIAGEYSMADIEDFDAEKRMQTGIRNVSFPQYMPSQFTQEMTNARIDMRSIECSYGKTSILSIPEFHVDAGEIIAITGKNGVGKSTFATSLCGLLKKQKGTYCSSAGVLSCKQRIRNSYMVLQEVNHQLFADSVRAEITLGISEPDEEKLQDILKLFDLTGLEYRHPMTLSGGQKQRVAIAAAMFCEKSLLVFDEPTSGLDYFHMMKTGELLSSLRSRERFLFVITHDYEFIVNCCDRVICLENGTVKESFILDKAGYAKIAVL